MKKIKMLVSILVLGALLVGCSGSGGGEKSKSIEVVGSTSVSPIMEKEAEVFQTNNSGTLVNVQSVGSSAGIKAVGDGTADVGMSSRELKEEEKAGLDETVIAFDGIAVVVHKDNQVADLTKEDVIKIYKGEITNWKDVGGKDADIVVISREEGSGTRGAFEELLELEGEKEGKTISLVSEDALIADGNGAVKQNVSSKEGAIGYLSLGSIDETLKSVKVDGVEASVENVKNKTYAIQRPFILLTKGELSAEVKALIDFVLSEEGQKIVTEEGYITVK